MENKTELGMNRTGMQMSPVDSEKMREVTDMTRPSSQGDREVMAEVRREYIRNAEPVGTVPPPGTLKGAAKSGVQALTGKRAHVLIDKLGERLAFERSGTRLYEAVMAKCQASGDAANLPDPERLQHFCDDEARHFKLVAECIESLGADPTAQTPCADVTGVESIGLMQVVSDPQTTVNQSVHAILLAELADNAGWEELIVLAKEMGQDEMAQRFEGALAEEREHLQHVRRWHEEAMLAEARVVEGA
ncbi:MAG TPA: ferritin-like domain-containing protein [Burkholderiales bacterium]|nr:ferritin-like domain-containing protein [Burkholderiales bacterium]